MDNKDCEKLHNKQKNKNIVSSYSESTTASSSSNNNERQLISQCPLLAKDSEWVDILQVTPNNTCKEKNKEEEVSQLVDSEDGLHIKPLALMFPRLLEEDPEMLEGIFNKVMSTTEVTKHLVGQKANFKFMKKVNRLIPTDKKWLESVTENSTSCCSKESHLEFTGSDYEADTEESDEELNLQIKTFNFS